jgi:LPXTG-motif cell wall-anchored protein
VIAGATYALVVQGPVPVGDTAPPAPVGVAVPAGDTYWGQGTTDAQGLLSFGVPAGYSWCLTEIEAPAGYQPDPALHCTPVLTMLTSATDATVALPEVPLPGGGLAFTGGPNLWAPLIGALLIVGGFGLLMMRRRSEDVATELLGAGALIDGVDEHPQPGEVPFVEAEGEPG